jgi:cobalt/nickel transport system permease protein
LLQFGEEEMHIPDGFVSGPINLATAAASVGVVGYALRRAGKDLDQKKVPLLGVVAAFVFAAQMLNFPVAAGTSGHFMGAALAAVLLGPFEAVLVMALVLVLQCLMFGDGGVTALGSNIFNMGIVGALVGYAMFAGLRAILPKGKGGMLAATAVASWFSIVAAAATCAVMLGASGRYPLELAVPAMAGVHAVIGVGEAAITAAALALVVSARPDLVYGWRDKSQTAAVTQTASGAWGVAVAGLAIALVMSVLVSSYASGYPDGLEKNAIEESAREIAEAAREEIARPGVVSVAISANAEVAAALRERGGVMGAAIEDDDEAGIFQARIVAVDGAGGESVREFEQRGAVWRHSPIADYEMNVSESGFVRIGVAGLVGTVLAFGIGFAVAGIFRGRKR